jgi:hypothetical protein
MGRSRTSDISVAQNELIKKGLVLYPGTRLGGASVLGMYDFINRRP